MATSTQWQLIRDAAERYERIAMPAILGPFAQLLVEWANLPLGAFVLDVGCGTAAAARSAHTWRVASDRHEDACAAQARPGWAWAAISAGYCRYVIRFIYTASIVADAALRRENWADVEDWIWSNSFPDLPVRRG
jgi:hypothetical protein